MCTGICVQLPWKRCPFIQILEAAYVSLNVFELMFSHSWTNWMVEKNLKSESELHVFTTWRYASDMLSSCVRLCVTSRHCTKTAKRSITQTMPYNSPGTLVFSCQRSWRNSNWISPMGAPNGGGVGHNWPFLTSISLYLRSGAR